MTSAGRFGGGRRSLVLGLLLLASAAAALTACSVSPAERAEIEKAWAERGREMAAECRRNGVGYAAGGCIAGGP